MKNSISSHRSTSGEISTVPWMLLLIAWLIALFSSAGALFIGEIMGQAPCNLCWYQRAFMFPLAAILAIACYRSERSVWPYAFGLSTIGFGIAMYHSLLYFEIVPKVLEPCGAGPSCSSADMNIFSVVPIPVLSMTAFLLISLIVLFIPRGAEK